MIRAWFPFLLLPAALNAQAVVDIRLRLASPNETHVVLLPHDDHHGVFSSVAFTLRWPADGSLEITAVQSDPACGATVAVSGEADEEAGRYHQVFAGFGFTSLDDIGAPWAAGEEVVVLTVSHTGAGALELVNDDWSAAHNGDYYLSLNGADRTGDVLEALATALPENEQRADARVIAYPNPTDGPLTVAIPTGMGPARVRILDGAGRVVLAPGIVAASMTVDLGALPAGCYVMRCQGPGWIHEQRITKQ